MFYSVEKFGVNSIEQATRYASNRVMIYQAPFAKLKSIRKKEKALSPSPKKRKRLSAED